MKKEESVNYAREYIIEQLSNGFSLDEIKKKLLEFGYAKDVINEALNYKEKEEIKRLNEDIRKLRIENNYLKRDISQLKNEKPGTNLLLILLLVIIFSAAAFSFGFISKDILKKDYVGEKFGANEINESTNSNLTSFNNTGLVILGSNNSNESSNISEVNLNTCSNLNGYLCNNKEICNGVLLNSIENNCCSIPCEPTTVLENCEYSGCNSPNIILPCICGNIIADNENLWCCAFSNQVFSSVENENCIFCGGFLTPPGSF